MNTKLFIAEKIKVGFNPRIDTYTGRLGYVIGHDGKKWRKETSWEGWRYHHMDEAEYEQSKRKQYNDRLTQQTNYFGSMTKEYEKNKTSYSYYRQYIEMGLDAYLKQSLGEYTNFRPHLGNVSSDEKLMPVEFENVPTEGFVLNKKAGGYSSGWNARATYCRVYDPRGFEFEISIPNLLFILQECNAMKGKGLEGSFVYSWDGKDLVLLPTSCSEYQASAKFTKLQSGKVGVKDLTEGCTYKDKQMNDYIYLGKFNWFVENYDNSVYIKKIYIFISADGKGLHPVTGLNTMVQKVSDTPVSNYAELLDILNKDKRSGNIREYVEDDYSPAATIDSYYYRRNKTHIGNAVLPLGDNKYELYTIDANADTNWTSSYGSSKYQIKSYHLECKQVVTIKADGDFTMKTTKPKKLENVSKATILGMKLKVLKTKNNKKQIYF